MSNEIELWRFVASCLADGERVMLLIVADSSGSSPGRAGYKMAVAASGDLIGSIGGGVMEVSLAEAAKLRLESGPMTSEPDLVEQVHRRDSAQASGMICSGRQTVIQRQMEPGDMETVQQIVECIQSDRQAALEFSDNSFQIIDAVKGGRASYFSKSSEKEFVYQEHLGVRQHLCIVGGGHCALALSELASRLGFRISIFDDRPELNTLTKNKFADEITIVENYEDISEHIANGNVFVVVMTLGYVSDGVVIRRLLGHDLKYLGVLGSRAKMATLMRELREEGFDADRLARIRAPIGLPINSRTPEEIAVSIAAEIIEVRNS